MKKLPYYVYEGTLFSSYTGCGIEKPAMIVDAETSTLHKHGEYDTIVKELERFSKLNLIMYPDYEVPPIRLIILHQLTVEEQAYILNRAILYSGTRFISDLCRVITQENAIVWLHEEMNRVRIEQND